jgi:DNA-binding NarL/FixJ family response regulator
MRMMCVKGLESIVSLKKKVPSKKKARTPGKRADTLSRVRAGVERFILKDATMGSFLKTLRSASGNGGVYSHQLTGPVLSRIVREAVRKRKQKQKRTGRA